MARGLGIEWIVPQHGPSFRGKAMVAQFIDWVSTLEGGQDLLSQDNDRLPRFTGAAT